MPIASIALITVIPALKIKKKKFLLEYFKKVENKFIFFIIR
jgi:hypothetical protein